MKKRLNKLSNTLSGWLLDNLALKVFSLLVALMLWLFITGVEDETLTLTLPIDYKFPENLLLLSHPPEGVTIVIQGKLVELRTWQPQKELLIDFSDAGPGKTVQNITPGMLDLPETLKITRISPAQVTAEFVVKGRKELSVAPQTKGNLAKGYRVDKILLEPNKVWVEGEVSEVQLWTDIFTKRIDIEGKKDTFVTEIDLEPIGKTMVFTDSNKVQAKVVIGPVMTTRTFNDVAVTWRGDAPEGQWRIAPDKVNVTLEGPEPFLETIKPGDFATFIDIQVLAQITSDASKVMPMIWMPPEWKGYNIQLKSDLPMVTILKEQPTP